MADDKINQITTLSLNANWVPAGWKSGAQAICAMMSGDRKTPPALGVAIDYAILENGVIDFNNVTNIQTLEWEDWMKLPVRPHDFGVKTVRGIIRIPTVIIHPKFSSVIKRRRRYTKKNIFERDNFTCFTENTLIKLEHEIKKISDIKLGDNVYDKNNNLQSVINIFSKKYKGDLIKIKGCGQLPIISTPEHIYYSINKSTIPYNYENKINLNKLDTTNISIIETPVKNLNIDDFLITPLPEIINKCENIEIDLYNYLNYKIKLNKITDNFLYDYYNKHIERKLILDNEFCFFIGLFLAEGSYQQKLNGITISLHKDEQEVAEKIKIWLKNRFHINSSIRIKCNKLQFLVYSKWIGILFLELFGNGSKTKYINKLVYDNSNSNLLSLIQGYALGDGCLYHLNKKHNSNKTTITSINYKLLTEIQYLSNLIGIYPTIHSCFRKKKNKYNYYLTFQGNENNKLWNINLKYKISNKRYIKNINGIDYMLSRITKTEFIKSSDTTVYDFEVENTHSYIANGYAVHNCQYTGIKLTKSTANIDHVIPKSKGGKTTWENCVTSHKDINNKKGNKLNHEIGLKLIKKPIEPEGGDFLQEIVNKHSIRNHDWNYFLKNYDKN